MKTESTTRKTPTTTPAAITTVAPTPTTQAVVTTVPKPTTQELLTGATATQPLTTVPVAGG